MDIRHAQSLGFASDEYDSLGVTFRALHAHAWTEFRNDRGAWQRLDATPGNAIAQRSSGIPIDEDEDFASIDFAEDEGEAETPLQYGNILSISLIVALLVAIWLVVWRFGKYGKGMEKPETRLLRKSTNALISCAQECGISIQALKNPHRYCKVN